MNASSQAEIARRVGVTQATVSRCLRNHPKQNPETCKRVLQIASELGYIPNSSAVNLARSRTGRSKSSRANLAIIGGNMDLNPVVAFNNWSLFLKTAGRYAESQGYSVEYFWRYTVGTTTSQLRRIIEARGIIGVILLMISPEELDLPWDHLALCSAVTDPNRPHRTHYVSPNPYHETCEALRECAKLGYKRPGLAIDCSFDAQQTEGATVAAFLFHLHQLPAKERIPIYNATCKASDPSHFTAWVEKYRPDVLLDTGGRHAKLLEDRIPGEIGFVNLSGLDYGLLPDCTHIGTRTDLAGIAAVDIVTAQLSRNERGLPEYPRCLTLPSEWAPGSTTRRIADKELQGY